MPRMSLLRRTALAFAVVASHSCASAPPAQVSPAPVAPAAARTPTPAAQAVSGERWKDKSAPVAERVAALHAQMTLEEKVAQMLTAWTPKFIDAQGNLDEAAAAQAWQQGVGLVALPSEKLAPAVHAQLANSIQRFATQKTRLGIPALIVAEALHGTVALGATSFPQALALGSTWDPELLRQIFAVAAAEARALGIAQVLAPVVDVARDHARLRLDPPVETLIVRLWPAIRQLPEPRLQ